MPNAEIIEAIYKLIVEIATSEKKKAISIGDYGTVFVAIMVENIFKEAISAISPNRYS